MSTFDDFDEPLVNITLMLADSAQVADGKLFILGGGLTAIAAHPQPVAIAMLVDVPWDRANITHEWKLELLDEDGSPVFWDDQPVIVGGTFEAGRPAGAQPGPPLRVPMAINFAALPVAPAQRDEWRVSVDGTAEPEWALQFSVHPAQA